MAVEQTEGIGAEVLVGIAGLDAGYLFSVEHESSHACLALEGLGFSDELATAARFRTGLAVGAHRSGLSRAAGSVEGADACRVRLEASHTLHTAEAAGGRSLTRIALVWTFIAACRGHRVEDNARGTLRLQTDAPAVEEVVEVVEAGEAEHGLCVWVELALSALLGAAQAASLALVES